MDQDSDLDMLRGDFPEWDIETAWITVNSGPDRQHLLAHRGRLTLTAWTAAGLRRAIEEIGAEN